jgi:hypothetical protein
MLLDGTSLRSRLRYVVEHAVGTSAMINIAVSLPGLSHSVSVSGPILVYTGLPRHGITEGSKMPKVPFVGDDAGRVRVTTNLCTYVSFFVLMLTKRH